MNQEELVAKLERLLGADVGLIQENLILTDEQGRYHLFGRYEIQQQKHKVLVKLPNREAIEFGLMRAAVSWCIADKCNQYSLCDEIKRCDQRLQHNHQDHQVLAHVARRIQDSDRKAIAEIKSDEARLKYLFAREQLTKCVSRAKYFQIRGFNDEIARTRRPTPTRTSRPAARKPNR